MPQTVDMSLAEVSEMSTIDGHSQDILKRFQWAVKRVINEHSTDDKDMTLTQDELIKLIQAWEPKRDIICLYVRWARQLRRNFNLDSIATLLCLSRQCGYTPVDFLRKVKTLSICKNLKAAYGVTFHFDIPNRKDIDRERLNKEFLGLSVTLSILQEQVTDSPSILGKTGMRNKGPRTPYQMTLPIDSNSNKQENDAPTLVTHPNAEFHTKASLLNRIWISINHRWLALHLTEHLFREGNAPWSYFNALVYSFQMMSPCGPGRFEFLSPLAGYCMRFSTQESIESKRSQLKEIWSNSSSFMSFGNTCLTQFSTEAQSRIIVACFQALRSDIPPTSRQISYHRDCSWLRRWTILRAYIFHFWLDSASNNGIKSMVTNQTSANPGRKSKRKIDQCHDATSALQCNHQLATSIPFQVQQQAVSSIPKESSSSGFQSIKSSRRAPASTIKCNKLSATVTVDSKIGHNKNTSNLAATNGNDLCLTHIKDTDWTSIRPITLEEMKRFVRSYLLIHRLDGVDVLAELSPLEVYSANHLHDLIHCRASGGSTFFPTGKVGPVMLQIRSEADCFIDRSAKSFHVAREQTEFFEEHASHLPSMRQIQLLCQAIVCHGKIDSKRAVGQHRLNIGNGGQNWVNGAPCELHGMHFQRDLEKGGNLNATEVLQSIGQLTEFTWRVMCGLQNEAADHPIAPDVVRKRLYAARLNEYLSMDSEVGFEDLTLVVSSLHPATHEVSEHKDTMNDTVAGYTRTAAFNMVLIDDNDDAPAIFHLQIICNFRKVIGHYVLPFRNFLLPVAQHARQYLAKWHHSIHCVFAGKTSHVPTAFDRLAYFLDDTLDYTIVTISDEGKHKQSISAEYILTDVNISRTLSFSMFIDPIVKLQHCLKFDQTIEMAFACSFLSNPFWFEWSMSTLIQRLGDPNDTFELGLHPFYDWAHNTIQIFGSWQGGPYNRWSPCGGNKETVLETFGAHPGATREERVRGEGKLSEVITILWEHVIWINSLSACGNTPVVDMPLALMKARCDKTIKEIAKVASCQFSHFRLGILTTVLSGCGLLKEGKHLRNFMYPVKGSASFKHLCCPVADFMSPERARALSENKTNESISNDGHGSINEDQHDLFMQYLSAELGFKVYVRDEIECILCESHPMRSLNCRDWFRKGMALYDCNERGEFFRRDYGRDTSWVKLHPPLEYKFAFLEIMPIHYIPLDAKLSYYANDFGNELRSEKSNKVQFKGRQSRTSCQQQSFTNSYNTKDSFCPPTMKVADFYMGSHVKRNKIRSMFVLGDAEHAMETSGCNDLEKYQCGKRLHGYLWTLPISNNSLASSMSAGCYHMDSEVNNGEVSFFPGHVDKSFVHTVWFVCLGAAPFFTILSVPSFCNQMQDADSMRHFQEWQTRLSVHDSKAVDDFLREFNIQAKKHFKESSPLRLIYLNKLGSVLSFPANRCYHATIIPKRPTGFPRDLFVVHPLDGLS